MTHILFILNIWNNIKYIKCIPVVGAGCDANKSCNSVVTVVDAVVVAGCSWNQYSIGEVDGNLLVILRPAKIFNGYF